MKGNAAMNVMLVDDSRGDIRILQIALQTVGVTNIRVAYSATEALHLLHQEVPHVMLLDFNMPGMKGVELLKQMREEPSLRFVPVVMLTSSGADQDVIESYEAGANAYLVKSNSFDKAVDTMRKVVQFWGMVLRPPATSPLSAD